MTDTPVHERQAQAIREGAPVDLRGKWERGELSTEQAYAEMKRREPMEKRMEQLRREIKI